jgi:biotin carboxyl carrier protein
MEKHNNLKYLNIDTSLYKTRLSKKFENRKLYAPANPKMILSFIPGTILEIMINVGQEVELNEELMILDAMKMQNKLKSAIPGRIKAIHVKEGDKVSKGTLLAELE